MFKKLSVGLVVVFLTASQAHADGYSYQCGPSVDPYSDDASLYHPTGIEKEFSAATDAAPTPARNTLSDDRVFGGFPADIKNYPGLVHLTFIRRGPHPITNVISDFTGMCGGTKISDDYIVTAAHCVSSELHAIKVTYGVSDVNASNAGVAWINEATCYKGYLASGLENDIALLKISSPGVDMRDLQNVSDAELMNIKDIEKSTLSDIYFNIAGWGQYEIVDLRNPIAPELNKLRRGSVVLGVYGPTKIRTIPDKTLPPSKQMSICKGDSGGPLYYYNGTKNVLTGVVSGTVEPNDPVLNSSNTECEKAYDADFTNIYGFEPWFRDEGAWPMP